MAMESVDERIDRRGFLYRLWLVMGGVALAEMLWIVVSFLRPRAKDAGDKTAESEVVAGPVEQFKPDSVTAFQRGRFYLVRLADGELLALSRRCTHLGCTVPWDPTQRVFACPCHASVFDMRGQVLRPPAPRALDRYPVRIENGMVKVDTKP